MALELLTISPMAVSEELVRYALSTPGDRVSTGVDRPIWVSRFLRSEHASFHCLMAGIAIALSIALAILFRLENISLRNLCIPQFLLGCGLPICAAAVYCHWAGYGKLRDGCWMVAWSCVFVNLLRLPPYLAARTGAPLEDSFLAHADRLMGVNVGSVMVWIHLHPHVEAYSSGIYLLLPWMVSIAVLVPAISGNIKRVQEFILAVVIATLIGCCVLAVFPAIGPWSVYHSNLYPAQDWYMHQLGTLRGAGSFLANPDDACGLITFPSFHVAFAIWSTVALWPFRWLRWPALALAVLISITTVTTGWHYASDGIGGILIAGIGITVAGKITSPRITSWS